jgi:ribonuclease HII
MLGRMALILGVDEAGRGPLAGPVAVGVIAVENNIDLLAMFPGLNDSKQLSEKNRERLYELLLTIVAQDIVRFHVTLVSAEHIDEKGIVHAVRTGVNEGIRVLMSDPSQGKVFLDGSLKASDEYTQETIIGGDAKIPAIMLASVAAKVTRDRYMVSTVAERFPGYGFEQHKGYGTKAHYAALTAHGLCSEHRRTFLKKLQ